MCARAHTKSISSFLILRPAEEMVRGGASLVPSELRSLLPALLSIAPCGLEPWGLLSLGRPLVKVWKSSLYQCCDDRNG